MFGDFSAQRYGRSGQKQVGIDVRATNRRGNGNSIGIQCKFKAKPETVKLSLGFQHEVRAYRCMGRLEA